MTDTTRDCLLVLRAATFVVSTLVCVAAGAAGAAGPDSLRTFLSDLPEDARVALAETDVDSLDARAKLDAVFGASPPYRFVTGPLSVYTDPRWFATVSASGDGAPLLEVRRWPGDTVLALWTIEPRDADAGPPVPGFRGEPIEAGEFGREWEGTVETDVGNRPAIWIERAAGEAMLVGALILPGDAGLGDAAIDDLTIEARVVLGRLRADPDKWQTTPVLPRGAEVAVPELSAACGTGSETSEPWQVVLGPGFTMGLPPGTRARSSSQGVAPPDPLPGQLLWFRGRYVDEEGTLVEIGDGRRVGYVARVPKGEGEQPPPVGAPTATRRASRPFVLAEERTKAAAARVERWDEPGFAGRWTVFRLEFADHALEIGLPMRAGWRSPSLYWIPITWRSLDEPPALPPIDSGERFGIDFSRLTPLQRTERPWVEGHLTVPGLRVELPRGWNPAATVRASDGFPVRFIDEQGAEQGSLNRLAADELAELLATDGWSEAGRSGGRHLDKAYERADGARLYVSKSGQGFLLEAGEGTDRDLWGRLIGTVRLTRPGR